ncbi:hypothetical protein K474DRAFT_1710108 [Panus rudis PR-1116 ss-1]|nr:hypothetical protein K474DRAFT_1710108 [Panus rudis PR-1116 ss-1]
MLRIQSNSPPIWGSKIRPLDVSALSALVSKLSRRSSQLSTIDIAGHMHAIYPAISPLLSQMDHVSHLKLKNRHIGNKLFHFKSLADHINGSLPCPELRTLILVDICIPWTFSIFHSKLTHLCLEYSSGEFDCAPHYPLQLNTLQDILECSPQLEGLSVKNCPLRLDVAPDAHPPRFTSLLHLKELTIVDYNSQPPTIIELLSRMIFPKGTTILLELASDEHGVSDDVLDELHSLLLGCSSIKPCFVDLHALALTVDDEGIWVRGWTEALPACCMADSRQLLDPLITARIVGRAFVEQEEEEAIGLLARMANMFRSDQIKVLYLHNRKGPPKIPPNAVPRFRRKSRPHRRPKISVF